MKTQNLKNKRWSAKVLLIVVGCFFIVCFPNALDPIVGKGLFNQVIAFTVIGGIVAAIIDYVIYPDVKQKSE